MFCSSPCRPVQARGGAHGETALLQPPSQVSQALPLARTHDSSRTLRPRAEPGQPITRTPQVRCGHGGFGLPPTRPAEPGGRQSRAPLNRPFFPAPLPATTPRARISPHPGPRPVPGLPTLGVHRDGRSPAARQPELSPAQAGSPPPTRGSALPSPTYRPQRRSTPSEAGPGPERLRSPRGRSLAGADAGRWVWRGWRGWRR